VRHHTGTDASTRPDPKHKYRCLGWQYEEVEVFTISTRLAFLLRTFWPPLFFLALILNGFWAMLFVFFSLLIAAGLWSQYISVASTPAGLQSVPSVSPLVADQRRAVLVRQLLLTMLIIGLAMLLHWWVLGKLVAPGDAAILHYPAGLQHLIAGLVALVLVLLFVGLAIGFAALLVVQLDYWDLGDALDGSPQQTPQRRWRSALVRAVRMILGLSQGTYILDGGMIYRPDWPDKPIEREARTCVGPAYIDAREGQVAIIETKGIITHAVT
jgi:hypothetical protein